jgi:hypothetical protein
MNTDKKNNIIKTVVIAIGKRRIFIAILTPIHKQKIPSVKTVKKSKSCSVAMLTKTEGKGKLDIFDIYSPLSKSPNLNGKKEFIANPNPSPAIKYLKCSSLDILANKVFHIKALRFKAIKNRRKKVAINSLLKLSIISKTF